MIVENIEDHFGKEQQRLLESFKAKLKDAADGVLSDYYTDVANYASTDAHTNYHNYLRDQFRDSLINEVTTKYGHYSWAHQCRTIILEKHKDALQNKIIEDLQDKVKSLEEHIEQMRKWR